MNLSVVGAGYVGLVTSACLASLGHRVHCIDADEQKVVRLQHGEVPVREPGLDDLVRQGTSAGRLSFHSDSAASHGTDLAFVAVGTLDEYGEWTGRHVTQAVETIARDPKAPRNIVLRSTLLPGTAAELERAARSLDPDARIYVNPEFTREATAVSDFLTPDRVVIGLSGEPDSDPVVADLRRIYHSLRAPFVVTDLTSAEMIKMAANVFLAAKITFANELARLCVAVGADVNSVVDGLGLDQRIGRSFLSPGPGFGGSCLPAQARALPTLAVRHDVDVPLLRAISPSNNQQPGWLVDQLEAATGRSVGGMRVAVLGLAFKAGTDDLRESPALRVVEALTGRGADVVVFDPLATVEGVTAAGSAAAACADADAVVVATEWPEFADLDWSNIAITMKGDLVVDARLVLDAETVAAAGLTLVRLGGQHRLAASAPLRD